MLCENSQKVNDIILTQHVQEIMPWSQTKINAIEMASWNARLVYLSPCLCIIINHYPTILCLCAQNIRSIHKTNQLWSIVEMNAIKEGFFGFNELKTKKVPNKKLVKYFYPQEKLSYWKWLILSNQWVMIKSNRS